MLEVCRGQKVQWSADGPHTDLHGVSILGCHLVPLWPAVTIHAIIFGLKRAERSLG